MADKKNEIVKKVEKNITDVVLNKVAGFADSGELVLPKDYSAENALKSAWLALQTVEDRNHKKALDVCSKESIANSLLDMVVQGLSPAKKQCYFIVYGKELTLSRSYMGTVAVAKRFSDATEVIANCVFEGDEFEYEIDPMTAGKRITKHVQSLENINIEKIKAAYAVVLREDKEPYVEIMTMAQIKKAWGQGATKGSSPAHKNFTEEMAKKTVINRACKMFVNTSSDSEILVDSFNRVTENDYKRDKSVDIVDVEEDEIKTLKDTAQEAVFGSDSSEKAESEESLDTDIKIAENEPEETEKTPFDGDVYEDVTENEEQVTMEGASDE